MGVVATGDGQVLLAKRGTRASNPSACAATVVDVVGGQHWRHDMGESVSKWAAPGTVVTVTDGKQRRSATRVSVVVGTAWDGRDRH